MAHSSSNCSPCNVSGSTAQQQIVLPVSINECLQTCSSNNGIEGCQPYFQPWDITANAAVTIPAVGGTFILTVCDATRFATGMWVQGNALGRYPIVALNVAQGTLTLQNGCSNGSAINGNPAPGTVVTGQQMVWAIGSAECIEAEVFQQEVFDALGEMDEENLLCLPNIAQAAEAEPLFFLGLTAACDSGDCPPGPDPMCLKVATGITGQEGSLCFIGGMTEQADDEIGTVVIVTDDGCLRKSVAGGFVSLRATVVNSITTGGGAAEFATNWNFNRNMIDYGVPGSAKAVVLRGYYYMDLDSSGNSYDATTFLRGPGEASNGQAFQLTSGNVTGAEFQEQIWPFYATVPLTPSDKRIYHEWLAGGSMEGSHNVCRLYLAMDGYYI